MQQSSYWDFVFIPKTKMGERIYVQGTVQITFVTIAFAECFKVKLSPLSPDEFSVVAIREYLSTPSRRCTYRQVSTRE